MAFDILIKKDASVDDTLRLIVNAVNVCSKSPFVLDIVRTFQPSDANFNKRVFDYVCRNAKYQLDVPGTEEVWTPEKVIREGRFDCKKVTVLLSSVLKAAGFEPVLKHVYYKGANGELKDYTHIYVILPNPDLSNYITLDPTNDCKYNSEVESSKQTLYFLNGKKMDLHMMGRAANISPDQAPAIIPASTLPINTNSFSSQTHSAACDMENQLRSICGTESIGLHNKEGNFDYTLAGSVLHAAKIPLLAIPRAAFLGLLYLGAALRKTSLKIHLPFQLAQAWVVDPSGVHKMWWEFGGQADAAALKAAVLAGIKGVAGAPSASSMGQSDSGMDYDRPYNLNEAINGIGAAPLAVPAAIAAASPIIIAFLAWIKKVKPNASDGPADAPLNLPGPGNGIPLPPGGIPATQPAAGSFYTKSIDTVNDAINFFKSAGVIMLGASLHPSLIIPTATIITASFFYAIKNKINF